jgi:hypothetical protein
MDSIITVVAGVDDCTLAMQEALLNRAVGHDTAAADGPMYGAKIGLATARITPGVNLVLGDLTLPTYTGYASSSAVTWGAAAQDDTGNPYTVGGAKTFTPSDDVVEDAINAVFCVAGDGTTLLWAVNLAEPVDIRHGKPMVITPVLAIDRAA